MFQALKQWQEKRPDLFVKLVYNLPSLDMQPAGKDRTMPDMRGYP